MRVIEHIRAKLAAHQPAYIDDETLPRAAVLLPLYESGGETHVLFTVRSELVEHHKGQISFPGGAKDPADLTPLHTALREANEELGIPPDSVEVLGMLGAMPTVTSYYVTPFVGVVPPDLKLTPNAAEIAEVIEGPLWRLRAEKRVIFEAPRDVYVWDDAKHVVWGATWRMVRQLGEAVEAVGR